MIDSNCLIHELKKLKESSKEAVENITSFTEFKQYMHIKRNVEDELFNIIEKSSKSNNSKLILICGGVGDGKSHIISYFKNKFPDMMSKFDIHNDGTESFEPSNTCIDTLNEVLKYFNDENILNTNKKFILAINLGTLNNFIDSKYKDNFKKLRSYVEDKNILDVGISDNSYDENSNFEFINFSDYQVYSLLEEKPKSQYLDNIINKIVSDDDKNIFRTSYNKNCKNCEVSYKCPIKINYEMLIIKSVQEKLIDLLIETIIKYKIILSTRSILNFLYDFLVNSQLDNKNNIELKKYIEKISFSNFIDCIFVSNLFEHQELSLILQSISKLDPVNITTEELDNLVIKINITDNLKNIFKEYLEIEDDSYLNLFDFDNLKTKYEHDLLKDKFTKILIRLNLFIPKKTLNLQDNVYLNYTKYLYYWNKGEKRKLANLYNDFKEAIFKWNGETYSGKINLLIGKGQMKYKISQRIEIAPDLTNLIAPDLTNLNEDTSNELLKFNPSLIISYKNDEKSVSHKIDVDFNLYELLIRVKNGYIPNKSDKYNYINFIEFINKTQKLGYQNKEIYIEDKQGISHPTYILSYNSDFEIFEFKNTNEV